MQAFRPRQGENGCVRLYDMHDSRAPRVEQFVHYRRTTEENRDAGCTPIFRSNRPRRRVPAPPSKGRRDACKNRLSIAESSTWHRFNSLHDTALTSETNRHIINFINAKKRSPSREDSAIRRIDNKQSHVNSTNGAGHPGAARDDRTGRPRQRYRGPGQLRQWLL
jgi:hypothetical protein